MKYFTKDYIEFFKGLSANNNKTWFQDHRKEYETHVRKPMIAFVEDIISEMQKFDKEINPVASKCLSRINRDIRFSKDKTPYNTHMWAHVTKGTKQEPIPGIAFRFAINEGGVMTGYYKPSKEKIQYIRSKIASNLKTFQKLKKNKKFVEKFGSIQGEAAKRLTAEQKEIFEKEPLIANKQFYYVANKKAKFMFSKDLLSEVMDYWHAARPMNDFFA